MGRPYLQFLSLFVVSLQLSACIPFEEAPLVKYIKYPIQRGDSIHSISERFDISENEIVQVNRLNNPRNLPVGATLKIPYYGQELERANAYASEAKDPATVVPDKESMKMVSLNTAKRYVTQLAWPVSSAKVSSTFGRRWYSFHEGVDLAANEGTPIRAAHDGEVVYSNDGLRGYGNLIVLKGEGILTVYGHNLKNEVRPGDRVKRGEEIAQVGSSGKSTGPHCHFETRVKDKNGKNAAVDPLVFFPTARS